LNNPTRSTHRNDLPAQDKLRPFCGIDDRPWFRSF